MWLISDEGYWLAKYPKISDTKGHCPSDLLKSNIHMVEERRIWSQYQSRKENLFSEWGKAKSRDSCRIHSIFLSGSWNFWSQIDLLCKTETGLILVYQLRHKSRPNVENVNSYIKVLQCIAKHLEPESCGKWMDFLLFIQTLDIIKTQHICVWRGPDVFRRHLQKHSLEL